MALVIINKCLVHLNFQVSIYLTSKSHTKGLSTLYAIKMDENILTAISVRQDERLPMKTIVPIFRSRIYGRNAFVTFSGPKKFVAN